MIRLPRKAAALILVTVATLSGCSVAGNASDGGAVKVVVGYQSKTINTVTAGTLLRSLGYLERRLGPKYSVEWQDHDTGAPITAKMAHRIVVLGRTGARTIIDEPDAASRERILEAL
ncbi:type 2 periplasmic-binding domain-containing protein [Streptosporangium soli]|nr:hypothetical protein [Streptosporangium sp. KLBMP 9127]